MELPAPELDPEPDWTEFDDFHRVASQRSFVLDGDDRLRVKFFADGDDAIVGKAWFGPGAEGPPKHAHGGSVAAVLDQAMGTAAWALGHTVLAGEINVQFLEILPLGETIRIETAREGKDDRRVEMSARLVGEDGTVYSRSTGTFIEVDVDRFIDAFQD